jgi:hypothetical protein
MGSEAALRALSLHILGELFSSVLSTAIRAQAYAVLSLKPGRRVYLWTIIITRVTISESSIVFPAFRARDR